MDSSNRAVDTKYAGCFDYSGVCFGLGSSEDGAEAFRRAKNDLAMHSSDNDGPFITFFIHKKVFDSVVAFGGEDRLCRRLVRKIIRGIASKALVYEAGKKKPSEKLLFIACKNYVDAHRSLAGLHGQFECMDAAE